MLPDECSLAIEPYFLATETGFFLVISLSRSVSYILAFFLLVDTRRIGHDLVA